MPSLITLVFGLLLAVSAQAGTDFPPVQVGEGVTDISELGLYGISYQLADGEKGELSTGWNGFFEPKRGIAVNAYGEQDGRKAFLLHAPWREMRDGWVRQTFRLDLPAKGSILLRFYTGMKEGKLENKLSDGVDFAVLVDGKQLWRHEQRASAWAPAEIDLNAYRGRVVDLAFEVGPGSKHDPNHDFALFADRNLVVQGSGRTPLAAKPAFQGEAPLDQMTRGFAAPAPLMPPKGVASMKTELRPSKGGLFDGWVAWLEASQPRTEFQLAYGAFIEIDGSRSYKVLSLTQTATVDGWQRIAQLKGKKTKLTVTLNFSQAQGSTARLTLKADRPGVSLFGAGDVEAWGGYRKEVRIPFLGQVYFMPLLGAYARVQFDPWSSNASGQEGGLLQYQKLSDGSRLKLEETVYYSASPLLQATLPTVGHDPSPYREEVASKVLLDSWEWDFAHNANVIKRLAAVGLKQAIFVQHIWQRDGYDNGFPDVLPADEKLGGDEGLKALANAARDAGMRFALHENYVDLYENAPSFDLADVARDEAGVPVKGWYNKWTKVQSLAIAPSAMRRIAARYSNEICQRYGTTAGFLDVSSAVEPGWNTDMRAGVEGAGSLRYRMEQSRLLFQDLRKAHNGPLKGEGNHHWWYSGLLDGVEAQFGQGWPLNAGTYAPVFPDFAMLSINPLQVNHGMGYLMRWLPEDTQGLTPALLDQLRMQQVAYGHAGFVGVEHLGNLSVIWGEMGLMPIVAKAINAQRLVHSAYPVVNASQTLAEGKPMDQIHLRFTGGLQLWANGSGQDWTVQGHVLPPHGWLLQGPDILAYSARQGGGIVDYAQSSDQVYVNTRRPGAGAVHLPKAIPSLQLKSVAAGAVEFNLQWQVSELLPVGMEPFFQLVEAKTDKEVAYPDHGMARKPDQWAAIEQGNLVRWEPKDLKDGDYRLKIGLWFPGKGDRFALLSGKWDTRRATIAELSVKQGEISVKAVDAVPAQLMGQDRQGPQGLQDFGALSTDGSVRLLRKGPGQWEVWPFPGSQPVQLSVNTKKLEPGKKKAVLLKDAQRQKSAKVWTLTSAPAGGYTLRLE